MKILNTIKLIFIGTILFSGSMSAGPSFNTTAVQNCTSLLINCATSILNITQDATDFSNCTTPFSTCLAEFAFNNPPPTPEACYLSESAWENFYISIGAFTGIMIVNNLVIPAVLKGAAHGITKLIHLDPKSHPILNRIGRFVGAFSDADGNGTVTASELLTPQSLITFTSLCLPFFYWYVANDAQARCDYAWADYKYTYPQVDDDDWFKY